MRIEDYALIGNRRTAALVGRNGSIDWLPFPRFDSPACFAAILGLPQNGRWLIAPNQQDFTVDRRYRDKTAVLESTFSNSDGTVTIIDCMNRRAAHQDVLRIVRGVAGHVRLRMELVLRCDYGSIIPRFNNVSTNDCEALAGPDRLCIHSDAPFKVTDDGAIRCQFEISAGEELCFSLTWSAAHESNSRPDVRAGIEEVTRWWTKWAERFRASGEWAEPELRSLITIQALTDERTGGFVAAATTSLPEQPGGSKNWDYRYCWLRDGAFSLRALVDGGFKDEAEAWCNWLLRAVAGSVDKLQIMYGIEGERNLKERQLPWLAGFGDSQPVRCGNAASDQFQLDIYGQILDVLFQARIAGINTGAESWSLEKALIGEVIRRWRNPGAGIWELRVQHQQFTESKVMAWCALDRGIKSVERLGLEGPVAEWRRVRAEIHDEVCRAGFNPTVNSFVQYYGADALDGSVLLLPVFDFIPAADPRMVGTVSAIEKHLLRDGLVVRYREYGSGAKPDVHEGPFLACSFWLVDNYVLQGRMEEARELLERLLSLRNDLGLLSEEFDTKRGQLVGNYPQALSHAAMITSIHNMNKALYGSKRSSK